MVSNEVNQYIEKFIPARSEHVLKMEQYAKQHDVPIMELSGMETLLTYVRLKKPARILEVGTAIGYSAIRMALASEASEIISIERDEERYNIAKENINVGGPDYFLRALRPESRVPRTVFCRS